MVFGSNETERAMGSVILNKKADNNSGINPAMLKRLQNVPGFVPMIISIQPNTDLREFLHIR